MRRPRVSIKAGAALAAASGIAVLASCVTAPDQITHTSKAQAQLSRALAGRSAGPPVDCIRNYPANQMHIVDDSTILFDQGGTVYIQQPRGGCPGIDTPGNVLITRSAGTNSTCSGDIGNIVHIPTGMGRGSCIFSQFVPYRKAQ
jgi:hypothetical protein